MRQASRRMAVSFGYCSFYLEVDDHDTLAYDYTCIFAVVGTLYFGSKRVNCRAPCYVNRTRNSQGRLAAGPNFSDATASTRSQSPRARCGIALTVMG